MGVLLLLLAIVVSILALNLFYVGANYFAAFSRTGGS
jgi:hypothetical protein